LVRESELSDVLAVSKQLRKQNGYQPEQPERDDGSDQPPPAVRPVSVGQRDDAYKRDGHQAGDGYTEAKEFEVRPKRWPSMVAVTPVGCRAATKAIGCHTGFPLSTGNLVDDFRSTGSLIHQFPSSSPWYVAVVADSHRGHPDQNALAQRLFIGRCDPFGKAAP
jgi:hypothetical protein